MNYNIKLNLQALQGAFVTNLKGKTATKTCLCIPVEENGLFVGQKGTYLNLSAIEVREVKFEDTHLIKRQYDKDAYKALSEEERKSIPIIGGMKPMKNQQGQQAPVTTTTEAAEDEDLPF